MIQDDTRAHYMNDDAISTNDNTRIIFNELPPPPLPPPDEDVSINNLRMSIVYRRVTVKSNSLFRKWVCRFIGQIYIFQVSTLVLLVREIIVAIVVVDGDY
jgi:hypothetical protein